MNCCKNLDEKTPHNKGTFVVHKKYSKGVQIEVLKAILEDKRSVVDVAKEKKINRTTIYGWVKRAKKQQRADTLQTVKGKEPRKYAKRTEPKAPRRVYGSSKIKVLEQEVALLKKLLNHYMQAED